ncbi:Alpha/Beta hydrolase protein [Pterulicium gracile]|uniref:Alpha/Beta hydrolase protein n=1 Tax=Pterulicium gracile TaxID=1884261 RepID=A0A5C3QK18_9AGAR|nr:Alpha/Beta hydrolase protein [Pterula gracilis]
MYTFRKFGQVTWRETLGLYSVLLGSPVVLFSTLLSLPFVSRNGKSRKRYVLDMVLRFICDSLGGHQMQYFTGKDEVTYRGYVKKLKQKPDIELVAGVDGAPDVKLLWIGKKEAKKVVYFLHGGGFVLPLMDFHLPFWSEVMQQAEKKHGGLVRVAILEYTLATVAPFPTQLREASAGLQHILHSGIDPSQIVVAGDSAGANLTYQLLQHILQPRLSTVAPIVVPSNVTSTKLGGAFLASPWFDLLAEKPSIYGAVQAKADIATDGFLNHCAEATLGGLSPEIDVEARKWLLGKLSPVGLREKVVNRVLVFGGGQERLIDSILEFAETMKTEFQASGAKGERCEVIVQPNGTHDDFLYDFLIGERSEETKRVVEWVTEVFN